MAELSEIEQALLMALGGTLDSQPSPTQGRPKRRTPTKQKPRKPEESRKAPSVEIVGPIIWADVLDQDDSPPEHILKGTNEALVFARQVVRGEILADAKTRVSAARLLTDLGVAQVELQQQAERDRKNGRLATEEELRAKRKRALKRLLRAGGV